MALNLEGKKAIVAEVSTVASESISLVVADYRGIAVPKMTDLRKRARASGIYLRVIRNTLARRAIKGTGFECLDDKLTGPLVFGFSKDEPGAAAKLFRDFAKKMMHLKFKGYQLLVNIMRLATWKPLLHCQPNTKHSVN